MRSVQTIKVLCLALVLTVTLLMSPTAGLAAPAVEGFRPAAQVEDAGAKCASPGNDVENLDFFVFADMTMVALQHGHHNRCEQARRQCYHECRHYQHHHHQNCFSRCMRHHDCH